MLVPAWSTYESGIFVLEVLGRFLFGFEFLLLAVLLMPANRARVHRWLGSLGGKGASREQEAAAVAELVGSRDATKLLAEADDRFRAISFEEIGTSSLQSRAVAGVANGTYLFSLPGSSGACATAWDKLLVHQLDYRTRPCNLVELMPRLLEHRQ